MLQNGHNKKIICVFDFQLNNAPRMYLEEYVTLKLFCAAASPWAPIQTRSIFT